MLIFVVLIALGAFYGRSLGGFFEAPPMSYSQFRAQVDAGNVEKVELAGARVSGHFTKAVAVEEGEEPVEEFVTYLPSTGDDALLPALRASDVRIETKPPQDSGAGWGLLLMMTLPLLVVFGLGWVLYRGMQGQGRQLFSVGKSTAKRIEAEHDLKTRFTDLAGTSGAKESLEEVVDFLKKPERFTKLGAEPPRGILLVGPPGTGKTLLARAVAGEANVPFYSTSGSAFVEMFVGVGASRVRDLFADAKANAPCIVFIDELDSVGRRRGAGVGGGHDEREQTLNQLLAEMDGFEVHQGVIVLAATNRADVLDPALLRPGRFDRRVSVDPPTRSSRKAILEIHSRGKPIADDVDFERIAAGTPGFSGADLKNLVNEAAVTAARADAEQVTAAHLSTARDRILLGRVREGMALSDDELKVIAHHEAGHAIVAAVLPNTDPVDKVTIVPRGRAMGVTQQLPESDRYITDVNYLADRLAVMLGGRAGEIVAFDKATTGAADDFKQATRLARRMVAELGLTDALGKMAFGDDDQEVFLGQEIGHRRPYSETTAALVDDEVHKLLDIAYERAMTVIRNNEESFRALARRLVKDEEVDGATVLEIVGEGVRPRLVS